MTVMRLLACTEDTVPCPPASQVWVTVAESVDFASLGVTAADVATVFGWGVSAVLGLWLIGFAVGAMVAAVRRA